MVNEELKKAEEMLCEAMGDTDRHPPGSSEQKVKTLLAIGKELRLLQEAPTERAGDIVEVLSTTGVGSRPGLG